MVIIGFEAFFVSHDHKTAAVPKTEEDHSGKNFDTTTYFHSQLSESRG